MGKANLHPQIVALLKELRMPTIRQCYPQQAQEARAETLSYEQFLLELLRREAEVRRANRIQRNLLTRTTGSIKVGIRRPAACRRRSKNSNTSRCV